MKLPSSLTRLLAFLAWTSAAVAQSTTFVWTGGNSTTVSGYTYSDGGDAQNWQGGILPPFGSAVGGPISLLFGAGPNADTEMVFLSLPSSRSTPDGSLGLSLYGLEFTAPRVDFTVYLSSGALQLGSGGIVADGFSQSIGLLAAVQLTSNQTWSVDGTLEVNGDITEATPGLQLTKSGSGDLRLEGSNSSFSGGLVIQSGTLTLGANSTDSDGTIRGSAGAGMITLGDDTRLRVSTFNTLQVDNDIRLGNRVTFGDYRSDAGLLLTGTITPNQAATTVSLAVDGAVIFAGNLTNSAAGASSFTFNKLPSFTNIITNVSTGNGTNADSFPVAVLSGNNTYTGGTTADGAGLIFASASALPATGNILAVNSGYVGTAVNGGLTAILARVNAPASFSGSLGLDTIPGTEGGPNEFDDQINLSIFGADTGPASDGFFGLGTLTAARLTSDSTITPPDGGNYLFGGGDGTLYVGTNLGVPSNSPNAGVRVRSPFNDRPLTVYLQGNNTFTGNLLVDHSIVILDSENALPGTARINLDSQAYVGITESAGLTPTQLISHLNPTGYNADSILGFDASPGQSGHDFTITEPLDLSALNNLYIGTTTHAHIAGQVRAPSSGQLSLTGLKGGWLTIDSALVPSYPFGNTTRSGVNSVQVGLAQGSDTFQGSYVELANDQNTYAGGTKLTNGYLLVGGSSSTSGNAITSGPLGTGTLTFDGYDYSRPATLVVTNSDGVTLHNPVAFIASSVGRFGTSLVSNGEDDPNSKVSQYSSNSLTLAGALSGQAGKISFVGDTTFTLSGNNSGLHVALIEIGGGNSDSTRVVATHANALGDFISSIRLVPGADLAFRFTEPPPVSNGELLGTSPSPAPTNFVIGSIQGGLPLNADGNNASFIALDDGDSLTINQFSSGTLHANISGQPTDWSGLTPAPTTASVIKEGTGTLTLDGNNTFSGGLTINAGGIIAASNTALGTGNVTINGGTLGVANYVTVSNNLSFGPAGATLGGNATFATPITVGSNVTLAPGNSPGILTFTNGLTLAGGGTLSIDIVDLSLAAGVGYDTLNVTGGTLNLTATTSNPFIIEINSLSALSNSLGALTTNSSTAASLAILQSPATITGLIGDGTAGTSNLVLQTSNFTNFQPGTFSLSLGGVNNSSLLLNFTPVPEPSTYALLGLGLAFVGWQLHRRRRDR